MNLEQSYLDLDLVEITGDVNKFLQGQISIDMRKLSHRQLNLMAFCNAKGKVVISGWILKFNDEKIWLILPSKGYELLYLHLSKYLPFYKDIQIKDLTSQYKIFFSDLTSTHAEHFSYIDNTFVENNQNIFINFKYLKQKNFIICSLKNIKDLEKNKLTSYNILDSLEYVFYMLLKGIILVDKNLTEEFLPQYLNYDLLEAISFNKGCWTGQEVISRLEFRGKVQRRLALLKTDINTQVKDLIFTDQDQNTAVGQVLSKIIKNNECLVLASIRQDILVQQNFYLSTGTKLELCNLNN